MENLMVIYRDETGGLAEFRFDNYTDAVEAFADRYQYLTGEAVASTMDPETAEQHGYVDAFTSQHGFSTTGFDDERGNWSLMLAWEIVETLDIVVEFTPTEEIQVETGTASVRRRINVVPGNALTETTFRTFLDSAGSLANVDAILIHDAPDRMNWTTEGRAYRVTDASGEFYGTLTITFVEVI